jgi:hypothetical protein
MVAKSQDARSLFSPKVASPTQQKVRGEPTISLFMKRKVSPCLPPAMFGERSVPKKNVFDVKRGMKKKKPRPGSSSIELDKPVSRNQQ